MRLARFRSFLVVFPTLLALASACRTQPTSEGIPSPVLTVEGAAPVHSIEEYALIPAPARLVPRAGSFLLEPDTPIVASDDPQAQFVAHRLVEWLGSGRVMTPARDSSLPSISLLVSPQLSEREGYRLTVDEAGIEIVAPTSAGLLHGAQTLRQLVADREDDKVVLACRIEDAPRFPYRGMHLDVGRHFFSVDDVKKYIEALSRYKYNTFHFHLTEDQGWRIEIQKYPKLTEVGAFRKETLVGHYRDQPHRFDGKRYGGFYTQEEIREIVAYAAEHHIEVIPEIELPGHSLAALAAYPELACTEGPFEVETTWGIFEEVYCPKEETFQFLEDVLSEVMALFPSRYVHIGGDEVKKEVWKNSPVAQAVMLREGLKNEEELQSYFIRRIEKFLNSRGKRLIGWDEILEGGLSPNATVMSWRGMKGGIEAAQQGHDVIMAPSDFTYFNLYQTADTEREPPAGSHTLTLETVYGFEPVPSELSASARRHILGAQGCVWTEYIKTYDHLEYMVFPRLLALAEVVWSPREARNFDDFSRRLPRHLEALEREDIRFATHFFEIDQGHRIEAGGIEVTLQARGNEAIHYTIDGSFPTNESAIYERPFLLKESASVSAVGFFQGKPRSRPTRRDYLVHRALGVPGTYETRPHEKYPGTGTHPLTDGKQGSTTFGDGQWIGLDQTDLNVTFDLGRAIPIERIEVGFLRSIADWIMPPSSFVVSTSVDGENFVSHQGNQPRPVVNPEPPTVERLEARFPATRARYVRVEAKNGGPLPSFHPGAGKRGWLFVDEVLVE